MGILRTWLPASLMEIALDSRWRAMDGLKYLLCFGDEWKSMGVGIYELEKGGILHYFSYTGLFHLGFYIKLFQTILCITKGC